MDGTAHTDVNHMYTRHASDCIVHAKQVDGVYVANVADEQAQPELKMLGGLQAVLFNIHVCSLQHTATHGTTMQHTASLTVSHPCMFTRLVL